MRDYGKGETKVILFNENVTLAYDMYVALEFAGFSVSLASSQNDLEQMIAANGHAILILDLANCGDEWLAAIRRLALHEHLRIIALTASGDAQERLEAVKAGVDIYLTKPTSFDELKAIIRRVVARLPGASLVLALDVGRQLLMVSGGATIKLTTLECWFLACLAQAPYRRASRQEVERFLWDDDLSLTDKRLDVVVHRLRKKLEAEAPELGNVITTHRSHGFSLLRETHIRELGGAFTLGKARRKDEMSGSSLFIHRVT
ncbi:response regulator transcription factor [Phyllobacterium phragmitis]|uniref:Response regulator n=1 Tax=Phyllobacterium phragmitis TaxID=2670329 RepID=A0ABQ0H5K3_9HYPH